MLLRYEKWAEEYLKSLPLEHFMEARPQAAQREVTLESLAVARLRRPDIHVFNEMLVQWPRRGQDKPGQVVPDNMVVLHDQPPKAKGSYNIPWEPARPFMMLEYVTKSSERKDYDDNMRVYERELKVPYYLVFYPDNQELTLFQYKGRKYRTVHPNEHGRLPIPELEMEVAIHEGWMRFWFRGELLPLPADLQRDLDKARAAEREARKEAEQANHRAQDAARRAADVEQRLGDEQRRRQDLERQLAELQALLKKPTK
jgi:hypothetical protein